MQMAEINPTGDSVLRTLNKAGYLKLPVGFTETYEYNLRENPMALPPPTVSVATRGDEVRVTYTWKKKDLTVRKK